MSSEYDKFQWREKEAGVWAREIDECEMAYTALERLWRGSGRSFFYMTGHITIKVPLQKAQDRKQTEQDLEAALAKAWKTLRYHHPTMAAQVTLDAEERKYLKVYRVDAEGWLDTTFKIIPEVQTGSDFSNSDPPAPALPTLNVVVPPQEDELVVQRDLVLRAPHNIIDGVGTLLLFDNYVRHAAEAIEHGDAYRVPSLTDRQVIHNLSPPFRVAANVPPTPSEATKQRYESFLAREEADASKTTESVTLPHKKGALKPGVHKRAEIILSAQETSRLTAASKSVGATVTHVFHAAISIVLRDLQNKTQQPRPVEFVGYLLRNERERCLPPYNDHRHPATTYHSVSADKLVVDMEVPSEADEASGATDPANEKAEFLRIVEQIKKFYLQVKNDPNHYQLAPLLWAKGITHPPPTDPEEAEIVPPVPKPSELASVSISSIGRLDGDGKGNNRVLAHQHGKIEIHHPWVTGEELRNWLGLFLGTFRGELSLSTAYNDAWYGREEAEGFLRRCTDVVYAGLGLSRP